MHYSTAFFPYWLVLVGRIQILIERMVSFYTSWGTCINELILSLQRGLHSLGLLENKRGWWTARVGDPGGGGRLLTTHTRERYNSRRGTPGWIRIKLPQSKHEVRKEDYNYCWKENIQEQKHTNLKMERNTALDKKEILVEWAEEKENKVAAHEMY